MKGLRLCLRAGCGNVFQPLHNERRKKTFCSTSCFNKDWYRKPEQMEASRLRSRRNSQKFKLDPEFRQRRCAQQQAYYHRHPERHYLAHIKSKYKMTPSDLETLLRSQNYSCAVCLESFSNLGTKKRHVDHDHKCCATKRTCGKCTRGILCYRCNTMMGLAEGSPGLWDKCDRYVEHWKLIHGTNHV